MRIRAATIRRSFLFLALLTAPAAYATSSEDCYQGGGDAECVTPDLTPYKLELPMQIVSQLSAAYGAILALFMGAAFGLSLSAQIMIQRKAQTSMRTNNTSFGQRLTYAGLSFAILALDVITGKHVTNLGYELYMLISGVAALACLFLRLTIRPKHK
jgi:hypothetical protein